MTERKTWSRDTNASIHSVYESLLRKGLHPSRPRWCSTANAFVVTANAEKS